MWFKKYYELLSISGQLNQTFNLSKYNQNQNGKETNKKSLSL
jgi:hypothetical protein